MHDREDTTMTNKEKLEITNRNKKLGLIFAPTKEQAKMFAHLVMPEIKKYFANEQIQNDFAKWQEEHNSA
jgi:mannose/fructose/N-acetylgalactosamine-specific phosphotransferase system component IID